MKKKKKKRPLDLVINTSGLAIAKHLLNKHQFDWFYKQDRFPVLSRIH